MKRDNSEKSHLERLIEARKALTYIAEIGRVAEAAVAPLQCLTAFPRGY